MRPAPQPEVKEGESCDMQVKAINNPKKETVRRGGSGRGINQHGVEGVSWWLIDYGERLLQAEHARRGASAGDLAGSERGPAQLQRGLKRTWRPERRLPVGYRKGDVERYDITIQNVDSSGRYGTQYVWERCLLKKEICVHVDARGQGGVGEGWTGLDGWMAYGWNGGALDGRGQHRVGAYGSSVDQWHIGRTGFNAHANHRWAVGSIGEGA